MINNTSDKNILRLIKYAPVVMVLCFALIMSILLFKENKSGLEREQKALSTDFIAQQRYLLKSQVDGLSRQISYEKNNALELLQHDIRERVLEAYGIAQSIYRNNSKLSKSEIGKRIKDALRDIRFNNGRGYFFASTLEGISELLPISPYLEGESLLGMKDVRGTLIAVEMLALMNKQDEAFYQWWFPKPNGGEEDFLKVGFIKRFNYLDWYIGTGEYLSDFEGQLQYILLNKLQLSRSSNSFSYYIIDDKEDYISHPDETFVGRKATKITFDLKHAHTLSPAGRFIDSSDNFMDKNGLLEGAITYSIFNEDWNWNIAGSIDLNELNQFLTNRKLMLEAENEETLYKIMLLSLLLTILLTSFSFAISQNTATRFKRYQKRILKNMNELQENKEQLNYLAYHDPLTNLPNRRALEQSIDNEIALCQESKSQMAVMFFDLDDFKKVNDHYGHSTGDALLVVLGRQFSKLLGLNDKVFRFGGDEFIFCFPQLKDISQAIDKVNLIQHVFKQQIKVCGNQLHVQGSIGIATYPNDAITASELIRKADLVLYKSKANKKGQYLFYDQSLHHQFERSLAIESQLRTALANNEFTMVYQPQICAKSQQIMGVEALIRWENSVLGNVPPDEFINIAENIGLIDDLGQFIIEQSCYDVANYNRDNINPITLSINVSPVQLVRDHFVKQICKVAHNCGLANSYITIEITENVLISEIDSSRSVIESFREHGFDVSLDDFGTGYSSLSYLSQLPINEIKIDRSFITEFLKSDQSLSLVKSIIFIAKSCHMIVVAEGVETKEQFEKLQKLGCDIIQGYYFSKPLIIDDLYSNYIPVLEA